MSAQEQYMRRCFQLALLGEGDVAPNPMVGAVLVHNNRIIGEGYHRKFGEAHAEVVCIEGVSDRELIKNSTLYVSLEPCSHFGKTPPCVDLIIKESISNVVIGCTDPFEKVNGSGIQKLKDAGIVVSFLLEKEAADLNRRFFTYHCKRRPYIILKWAQSKDRKLGGEERRYITNGYTNQEIHKWRSKEASIMVGTNTVLADNPELTTRHWPGKDPLRVIIDKELKLSTDAVVLNDGKPLVIVNSIKQEETSETLYFKATEQNVIKETIDLLYSRNILSLIVEGGAVLLQSFIDAGLWDEARVITNHYLIIGDGITAPVLNGGTISEVMDIGSDQVQFFRNDNIRP